MFDHFLNREIIKMFSLSFLILKIKVVLFSFFFKKKKENKKKTSARFCFGICYSAV